MASSIVNLQLLDQLSAAEELDLASKLFHQINRVIPQDQKLLKIPPNRRVRDAIALMRKHGYSQIPVVENGTVVGVFSFRSFAKKMATATLEQCKGENCASPGELPVVDFTERFKFAHVAEDISRACGAMARDNGILIGARENLIGIVTPMDFLFYFNKVASPFVMVWEIELAVRALIEKALGAEQIAAAAKRCLASAYRAKEKVAAAKRCLASANGDQKKVAAAKRCLASAHRDEEKVPTSLEDMTFDDYQSLVSDRELWTKFEPFFGGTRTGVRAKLEQIGHIRNDLFHFRRKLPEEKEEDLETLETHRDWLLYRIEKAEATVTVTVTGAQS